jgi:glycine oxidase
MTGPSPTSAVTHSAATSRPAVIVAGGGVIGLSIAWRLAQAGARVTVFDSGESGRGASHAAAGMLAACAEAEPGETTLLALNRASQAMWPDFAAELEAASGEPVDLRREGTLLVALGADDQARLNHLLQFQRGLGLPVEWMTGAEVRRREPYLSPNVCGALWSPEDHQVENRKLARALRIAAVRAGVTLIEGCAVEAIDIVDGCARGVVAGGARQEADAVVLAAGAWSRTIAAPGLPRLPVRPIKGQMIALQMDPAAPLLRHVVWAPGIYLVPRLDGRLLLGATVEEKGFDTTLTAGAQLALLEAAWRTLPGIEELPIAESWAGFRPGSRDDAPILGAAPVDGLFYATGHHRNGILLTPITAKAMAELITTGRTDPLIAGFGIARFTAKQAAE